MEVTTKSSYFALKNKIQQKTIQVGVIGMGYVGLPFLVEKARVGLKAVGIERVEARVMKIMQGESYISDVTDEDLSQLVQSKKLSATTDESVLKDCDVIVICVPTPLDKNHCPDLSFVTGASEQIAQHLRPGQLVSLESTTYPGTTEDVIKPILEKTGLCCGEDFFLAHSPERVDPGNKRFNTKNTNKVVGADDEKSLALAMAFYQLAIEQVVPVKSTKAAELVKVYENTFRSVNIALANEVALLCDRMEIDVWEMLDAAFTKPFGIMPFYPGPGVGGHCIPIDPHYLEWKAKEYGFNTRFITLAGEINRRMPHFVYDRVAKLLNEAERSVKGATILMLGMAYKSNLPDYRESPSLDVYRILRDAGANLIYHDPFIPAMDYEDIQASSVELTQAVIESADLVVITTRHTALDYHFVIKHAKQVFDTRNVTRDCDAAAKVTYL